MREQDIQNSIRQSLAGKAFLFRANVGIGWTGTETQLPDGKLVLSNPRRFNTGLPKGYADLTGWREVTITPDMVGQKIAQFIAIEVKTQKGRVRDEQSKFIDAVNRSGGCGVIARSVEDAQEVLK